MPEITPGRNETEANESPVLLFADGGNKALHGFGGHFIKQADCLAWQERSVHHDQRAVRAHELRKRF